MTQFEMKNALLLAHANVSGMKRKAHYPVTHTQIKTFTASPGAQQDSIYSAKMVCSIPAQYVYLFRMRFTVSVCSFPRQR